MQDFDSAVLLNKSDKAFLLVVDQSLEEKQPFETGIFFYGRYY